MLPPTDPPPHLNSLFHHLSLFFFLQSSSSPAFLTSLLSQASHLSIGLPRGILPSSRNSAALLVSLAIFRTQLFSHTCSLCCCNSVIAKVSSLYRHAGITQVLVTFSLLEFRRSDITHSTALHAFHTACALRRTSHRLRTIPLLNTRNCPPESASGGLCAILPSSLG